MKRITLILVTLFACISMSAQTGIPDCFFDIGEDEYVGVSLPLKDAPETRHDFALMTAMIQHPAFNQQMKQASLCRSTEFGDIYKSSFKLDTLIRFSYMQSDMYVNDYDEEYVKIKVGQGRGCEMRLRIADEDLSAPGIYESVCSIDVELKSDNGSSSIIRIFDKVLSSQNKRDFIYDECVIEVTGVTAAGQQYMFLNEDRKYFNSLFYAFVNEVMDCLKGMRNTKIGPKELKRLYDEDAKNEVAKYYNSKYDEEAFQKAFEEFFKN